jgi:nucleoside-diphosphate-sugar epimerase
MKIILTGADGFIGHHTAIKLADENHDICAIDNGSQNCINKWHKHIIEERKEILLQNGVKSQFVDCRMRDALRPIITKFRPDVIIHLAAVPSMVLANTNPESAFDNNVTSTFNILETVRDEKINAHLMFFSSSTVYGDFTKPSVVEDDPINPIGIYEATKVCGETLLKSYSNLAGIDYTIFRPSALYGPRCINNRVSQILIEKALMGEPLKLFGGGDEELDFTHIDDVVQGLLLAVSNREQSRNETFNLTRGSARPIRDLVSMIEKHIGPVKTEILERDRMRPKRGTLEINHIKQKLGYTPKVDLADGYPKYIEWYTSRSDLFKKLSAAP